MSPFLVAAVAASVATIGAAYLLPVPVLWIAALWALVGARLYVSCRSRAARIACASLASVSMLVALAEGWALSSGLQTDRRELIEADGPHVLPDTLLGRRPRPDQTVWKRLEINGEWTYEFDYTIGSNGLRGGSLSVAGVPSPCVWFFGSLAFGEGLEDDETLPDLLHQEIPGGARVCNFGFTGYGAHQMLAVIDEGRPEEVCGCAPTHVFYWASLHDVRVTAGLSASDRFGPRYVLAADGALLRTGSFGDPSESEDWLERLAVSRFVREIRDRLPLQADDVNLFLAITSRARDHLASRYPEVQFHILVSGPAVPEMLRKRWSAQGIPVHRLDGVLQSGGAAAGLTFVGTHYPTAEGTERIAAYVVSRVFR